MRRVDLANWALWTSPKFTTRVKYQFHQGFWPDQRSGNPNHPLPPHGSLSKIKHIKLDKIINIQRATSNMAYDRSLLFYRVWEFTKETYIINNILNLYPSRGMKWNKIDEMSVEKGGKKFVGKKWEKPRGKPTQTLFSSPRNPHAVTETQTCDPRGGRWAPNCLYHEAA